MFLRSFITFFCCAGSDKLNCLLTGRPFSAILSPEELSCMALSASLSVAAVEGSSFTLKLVGSMSTTRCHANTSCALSAEDRKNKIRKVRGLSYLISQRKRRPRTSCARQGPPRGAQKSLFERGRSHGFLTAEWESVFLPLPPAAEDAFPLDFSARVCYTTQTENNLLYKCKIGVTHERNKKTGARRRIH